MHSETSKTIPTAAETGNIAFQILTIAAVGVLSLAVLIQAAIPALV